MVQRGENFHSKFHEVLTLPLLFPQKSFAPSPPNQFPTLYCSIKKTTPLFKCKNSFQTKIFHCQGICPCSIEMICKKYYAYVLLKQQLDYFYLLAKGFVKINCISTPFSTNNIPILAFNVPVNPSKSITLPYFPFVTCYEVQLSPGAMAHCFIWF